MVNDSAVVAFDDERAVANAGVMLPALRAGRLGIERLVDETSVSVIVSAARTRSARYDDGLTMALGAGSIASPW
jgi:hypothetical protein